MNGPQDISPFQSEKGMETFKQKGTNAELGMIIIFFLPVFCHEKKNSCTMLGLKEFVLLDQ